jgi:hypothetical protein
MSGAGRRGKGANGNRKKMNPRANNDQVEELDEVRKQMKADYAKRSQVPQSVLLSHAAQLPPSTRHGSDGDDDGDSGDYGGERVRWLRDFAAVLENVYALPLDASISSTSAECRQFMDKGTSLLSPHTRPHTHDTTHDARRTTHTQHDQRHTANIILY